MSWGPFRSSASPASVPEAYPRITLEFSAPGRYDADQVKKYRLVEAKRNEFHLQVYGTNSMKEAVWSDIALYSSDTTIWNSLIVALLNA